MPYVIRANENVKQADYRPQGAARDFIYSKEPEVILGGPAETGKTLAACWKIHLLAIKYSGLNGAIVRKTYKSMPGSVLQTFGRVIAESGAYPYGGDNHPEKFIYPNGSVIWVGGMDNPDKVLSSERDFIYVNQAEELALDDWEKIITRTTGRGSVMPYTQAIGDCNPGGSRHWIRERARAGRLKLLNATHRDNPTLYDDTGALTSQGKRTMAALGSLTGVRRKRLLDGVWATAEGAVYDIFDPAQHVQERQHGDFIAWALACDEGYTNPAVLLLVGIDLDGRMHIAREFYKRGVLQADYVKVAKEWYTEKRPHIVAVDAAAAGLIADMRNEGIAASSAKGRVLDGIGLVQSALMIQGDGRPRLTIDPSCVNTINEFESYTWKAEKDEPVKENDHALDALRYLMTKLQVHTPVDKLIDFA